MLVWKLKKTAEVQDTARRGEPFQKLTMMTADDFRTSWFKEQQAEVEVMGVGLAGKMKTYFRIKCLTEEQQEEGQKGGGEDRRLEKPITI